MLLFLPFFMNHPDPENGSCCRRPRGPSFFMPGTGNLCIPKTNNFIKTTKFWPDPAYQYVHNSEKQEGALTLGSRCAMMQPIGGGARRTLRKRLRREEYLPGRLDRELRLLRRSRKNGREHGLGAVGSRRSGAEGPTGSPVTDDAHVGARERRRTLVCREARWYREMIIPPLRK